MKNVFSKIARHFCKSTKGGGLFEKLPPPPDPPKFSNPSFSNLRFRGKVLAPKAPEKYFFCLLKGISFLALCVLIMVPKQQKNNIQK